MNPILLSADSTCDIGQELKERYDVQFFSFHILLGEKDYIDMVDITPDEIYRAWRERGILPKTSAVTSMDYLAYFRPWVEKGYDVLHLNLGSALSSSYDNCSMVAENLNQEMPGKIYLVDSENLSTGIGHLVVKAGEMIQEGLLASEIQQRLLSLRAHCHTSFLLDTLEFMKAGGRCNAITALGASLLHIKPCILVDNRGGGKMGVGKKYQGSMSRVLKNYIREQLEGRRNLDVNRLFITHSGASEEDIHLTKEEVAKYASFREIFVTQASSTISCHCGPRSLGILYMTQPDGA